MQVDRLERRTLLSVTATLNQGALDVALSSQADSVTLTGQNGLIQVSDGSTTQSFVESSVTSIDVSEDALAEIPGLGTSSATFQGTIAVPGNINAQGLDAITVAAGATLSTRDIAPGANPLTAPSTAVSGALSLAAKQVTVASGASLLAQGSSQYAGGDVTLAAQDQLQLSFIPGLPFRDQQTAAGVDIADGATIEGQDVTVTSFASTNKLVENLQDTPADTQTALLADLNGDGKPDLIVANTGQPVRVYLNNGTSEPFDVTPILVGDQDPTDTSEANPTALAVGDINDDGKLDLVVGYTNEPVKLFINVGGSTLFDGSGVAVGPDSPTTALAVGDINGDGKPDLIVGGTDVPVREYVNNGQGGFGTETDLPGGPMITTSLALGDIDGTRRLSLVVGNDGQASSSDYSDVQVHTDVYYVNPPALGLNGPIPIGTDSPDTTAVALADLDGDGKLDLVLANSGSANEYYLNQGSLFPFGTVLKPASAGKFSGAAADSTSIAIGDFDGDGTLDVAFGNSGTPNQIYLNTGGKATFPVAPIDLDDTTAETTALLAGGVDGNGTIDLVQATDGQGNYLYANNGDAGTGAVDFASQLEITALDPQLLYTTDALPLVIGPLDLTGLTLFGGAVVAQAKAHIIVGAATITASNTLSLLGDAVANAGITTVGMALEVGIGSSTASTDVIVHSGAKLTAAGDLNLIATTKNTLMVSLVSPTLFPEQTGGSFDITIAAGLADSHADAEVDPGASIVAGSVAVKAANTNSFATQTLNLSFQAGGNGALGGSLVIADYKSDAEASLGGTVRTSGAVAVDATSTNTKDYASSGATVINKFQDIGLLQTIAGKLSTATTAGATIATKVADVGESSKGQQISKLLNLTNGSPDFSLAAALGLVLTTNSADAGIDAGADVEAGGALEVKGTATDHFQAGASASSGNAKTASLGGAILFASPSNTANAHIDPSAQVDSGGALTVNADAESPNVVDFLDFNAYIPDPTDPETSDPSNIVSNYQLANAASIIPSYIITPILGVLATGSVIGGDFANTYTSASATGDGANSVGVSVSLDLLFQTNEATATVGTNARINQRTSGTPGAGQTVTVNATGVLESIDPNGPLSLLGILGKGAGSVLGASEGNGAGGSLFVGKFANSAVTSVGDGAAISAGGDVAVTANSFNFLVGAAQAGDQSGNAGFQASLAAIVLDETTTANISNEATIVAGGDLDVTATSLSEVVNFTGGLTASANVGAGISGAFSIIDDTTTATIGGGNPADGQPGSIQVGGNLLVKARGVRDVISVGVAAASAVGGKEAGESDPSDSTGSTGGIHAVKNLLADIAAPIGGAADSDNFGVEVNGAIGFNIMTTDTEAHVSDLASASVGGDATIEADGQAVMVGAGGGAVLAKNAGVDGEFVFNGLFETNDATLDDTPMTAGQALVVAVGATAVVAGAAAGVGVSSKAVSLDGSAIVTPILDDDEAAITGPDPVQAGSIAVTADNSLRILPVAGDAAVAAGVGGRGLASVGAAIDATVVDETVTATVGAGADLVVAGISSSNVVVTATSTDEIAALAASFAATNGVAALNGSGTALLLDQDIAATIGAGASVTTPASVNVEATDGLDELLIAGGAAGSQNASVGASAAASIATRDIDASVGNGAVISAGGYGPDIDDDGSSDAHGLFVNAAATDKILHVAVDGAVTAGGDSGAAAVGSLALGESTSTVAATIGNNAQINIADQLNANNLQSVDVTANHETLEMDVAGGLAVVAEEDGGGLGAAAGDTTIDKTVTASIGTGAVVRAQDDVLVDAASIDRLVGFTVGLAGAGTAAVAGSVQIYVLPTTVSAFIDDQADVRTQGNVRVTAGNIIQVAAVAGQAAVSAQAEEDSAAVSLGASVTTTTITATTDAHIGQSAFVEGLGLADPVAAPTGAMDTDGSDETTPTRGVIVVATAAEDLATLAFGGSFAGANNGVAVALAGSATANVLNLSTTATIGQSSVINGDAGLAGPGQDVVVLAADRTRNLTAAGSLAASVAIPTDPDEPFAASASADAGADVLIVHKTTSATIDPSATVDAGDSVAVQALSDEESLLVSLAAGISVGPSLAIAGSAGVGVFVTTTTATIGTNDQVTAQGNVQVAADDDTSTALGVGNATVADVGGGVSVGAFVITPTTDAAIADGAVVIGRGLREAMTVATGGYTTTPTPYQSGTETFVPPAVDDQLPSGIDPGSTLTGRLTSDETSTANTATMRGVAVTANNQDVTRRFVAGVGVSGGAAEPVASVAAIVAQTHATIGNSAEINPGDSNDGATQSVLVAAGSDYSALTVSGAFAAGGVAAISPTADVAVVKLDTEATVGTGALVDARQDVTVAALATEDTLAIAAAGAGSLQGYSVVGTVIGVYIGDTTLATIGSGASVEAGGNVLVNARDDTRADVFAGTASYQGAGASIGVTPVVKDTEASIGTNATVDALGNSPNAVSVAGGPIADHQFAANAVQGVIVQAQSTETLFALTATGNLGGLGLAGSISAEVVDATTRAFIDSGSKINMNFAGAAADQSVAVVATDAVKSTAVDGTLTAGGVAIGGAVDAGIFSSNTSAFLGHGTTVRAQQDVDIAALVDKDVTSVVAGVALGSNTLGAAVSVVAIDDALDAGTAHDTNDTQHNTAAGWLTAPGGTQVGGAVDGQATGSGSVVQTALGMLGNYNDPNEQSVATGASEAQSQIEADLPTGQVEGAIAQTSAPQGVSASIGNNSNVQAGRNVVVDAEQATTLTQGAGVLSVGLTLPIAPSASLGASVTVAVIGTPTQAFISNNATVVANAANTGGGLTILAELDENQQSVTVTGTFNTGGYGLNAQVATVDDTSTQAATIGSGVTIGGAATVDLSAVGNRSLSVQAIGAGAASELAGGVSLASATAEGTTKAYTGTGVEIGQQVGLGVGSLDISATATTPITAKAIAVNGGIGGAAQGSVAIARANPGVAASMGTSNAVTTTGTTAITANWSGNQNATSLGLSVAGSFAVGVSYARADANPNFVLAAVQPNSTIDAGQLEVTAGASGVAHAYAVAAAGALLVGGTGVIASTVASPVVQATLGSGDTVEAGSVALTTATNLRAFAQGFGLSAGIVGIGVVLVTAVTSPTVDSGIGAGATVIATDGITLSANHTGSAEADGSAPGVGLASGAGAQTTATASATTETLVGTAAYLVGGPIQSLAVASNTATADSVTANIGAAAVGANMANASVDGTTESDFTGNVSPFFGITPGSVTIAATSTDSATASADATSGGLLAGQGTTASAEANPTVTADVGAGSQLSGITSLALDTTTTTTANANANGHVGGFIGVGITIATATASPTVQDTVSQGAAVQATGSVVLQNNHNTGGSGGAQATATNTAGGVGDGLYSQANATSDGAFSTTLGSSASIQAGGSVQLTDTSDDAAIAESDGRTVGLLVAVGDVLANADASSQHTVAVNQGVTIRAGGTVLLESRTQDQSVATTYATGGGAINSNGSIATATSSPNTQTLINTDAIVVAGGDVDLSNITAEGANAQANGTSVGGITVGTSSATSNANPQVASRVNPGATVTATGSISIYATNDPLSTYGLSSIAVATGSNGSLIVDQGTASTANFAGFTFATVFDGSRLTAGGDVTIETSASGSTSSTATADTEGFIAQGATTAGGTLEQDNNASAGGTIVAGGSFNLLADTYNSGYAYSSGSGGGLIDESEVTTDLAVLYITQAEVFANASITAGSNLNVDANSTTVAFGQAQTDATGLGISADVNSTVVVANLPSNLGPSDFSDSGDIPDQTILDNYNDLTLATIDAGAQLRANTITVQASVPLDNVRSFNYVSTEDAGGTSDGSAGVLTIVPALVQVATGASLTAPRVNLLANYTGGTYGTDPDPHFNDAADNALYNMETLAFSGNYIDTASIGHAASVVHNANFTQANVTTASGSTINTSDLAVKLVTPQIDINSRSQFTGGTEIGTKTENDYRRVLANDSGNFNSRVVLQPAPGLLVINPDGSIAVNQGFNVTTGPGNTNVTGFSPTPDSILFLAESPAFYYNQDDIPNNLVGTYSTSGFSGNPSFGFGGGINIKIQDASSGSLFIGGLTTAGATTVNPQVVFTTGTTPADPYVAEYVTAPYDTLPSPLVSGSATTGAATATITKTGSGLIFLIGPDQIGVTPGVANSLSVSAAEGDIYLFGSVDVPGGSALFSTPKGSIGTAFGGAASIEAATVSLAAGGTIGTAGSGGSAGPLSVILDDYMPATTSLQIAAGGNAFLNLVGEVYNDPTFAAPTFDLVSSSVGGNLVLDCKGATNNYDLSIGFGVTVIPIPTAATVQVDSLSVGGNATLAGSAGTSNDPTWLFDGPSTAGGAFNVAGGYVVGTTGSTTPAIAAASATLANVDDIGTSTAPLTLQVGQLTTSSSGDQYLLDLGNLATAAVSGGTGGLTSTSGRISLTADGALTLGAPIAAANVSLNANSINQAITGDGVTTPGALTVRLQTGGAGSPAQPFQFQAGQLSLVVNRTAAGKTFLAADGSTRVQGIDALGEQLFLDGGMFDDESQINALAVNLLAGTLLGTGSVAGPLGVLGGTVAPGLGYSGKLRTGPVTFQPGSTFDTSIYRSQSGTGAPTTVNLLQANGPVVLNGATLAGFVSPGLTHGSQFTIIQATSIVGQFAQGSQVVLGGQTFQIIYNSTNVVLVLDQAPVANAGGPYKIMQGASLTLDGSRSGDPDGDPLSYSWTINGHANAATGPEPTLTAAQLQALGITSTNTSFPVVLTVNDGYVSVSSSPVTVTVTPTSVPATVVGVGLSWGTQSATLGAMGSNRWLPAGRQNDIPWSNVSSITVTLSNAFTLALGDLSIVGKSGGTYSIAQLSVSGNSVTIYLTAPVTKADRLTVTLGNATVATSTIELDILPGDVNDDGVVNAADASTVQGMISGSIVMSSFADINGDGVVNSTDTTFVRQKNGTRLP